MKPMFTTRSPVVGEMMEMNRVKRDMKRRREKLIKETWRNIKDQGVGYTDFRLPSALLDYGAKRMFYDILPDGAWKSQRCFVIGGGPSLRGFDFSRLYGELTIGVNRAYEAFDCTIMFCMDKQFYNWTTNGNLGVAAKERFANFKGYKVWANPANYEFPKDIYLLDSSGGHDFSSSMRDGLGSGANSGFAAVNLAACLGANPIYLLGFDMEGEGSKQAWWHDGYPDNQGGGVYNKFRASFERVAPALAERGIKIINLNPKSALKCFDFGEFEKIEPAPGYEFVEAYDPKRLMPQSHKNLFFKGCLGFGDNFYQRAVIKDVSKIYETVYLMTCLPELYWDIPNVKFIYPDPMNLRTHKKHIATLPKETWSEMPAERDSVRWDQLGPNTERKIQTKYIELENRKDFDFTFPVRNSWVKDAKKIIKGLPLNGKKLCIVRRPTNRKEWNCPSRNPKIEYYQLLIDKYKDEYFFLSIADIEDGREWFDGELKGLDKEFNHGELPLTTIFGLMKIADMVITFPAFFMAAAVAIRAKCFCIFGGCAPPDFVMRKNLGLQNFAYIAPEPFCACHEMNHDCNKEIPTEKILTAFESFKGKEKVIKGITVGCPPGIGDTNWVMTKMESFKEKNAIDKLTVAIHRNPVHFYTAEYLKLIPFIDEVDERKYHFKFPLHWNRSSPRCIIENTEKVDYLIDFGGFMWIRGTSLSDIHPEYETHFNYPINIPQESQEYAKKIKADNGGKLVLFYTSAIGNNANWNGGAWKVVDWVSLAKSIFEHSGIHPVLIGAEWDRDYANQIRGLDIENITQDLVGKTDIAKTLALVREANLFISYPCGIPILAVYSGVPTVIFWPINGISRRGRFDAPFQFAWAPPGTKEGGRYIPVIHDSPEATSDWIFNRTKEFL